MLEQLAHRLGGVRADAPGLAPVAVADHGQHRLGLGIAARLNQLDVDTLVVDMEKEAIKLVEALHRRMDELDARLSALDLAAQEGDNALRRRFAHYARPDVLVIDEIGYLAYGTRHADLLFEIVNRRYERKPTIITTNLEFSQWPQVFGSEQLTGALLDRLTHHAHILAMNGESFRFRESMKKVREE